MHLEYSLPYLLMAGILYLLYLIEKQKFRLGNITPNIARWSAYILMWIFMGLRGHIMSDFISYVPLFEDMGTLSHFSQDDLINRTEIGFNFYTLVFKSVWPNYFAWVAFNTAIDLAVLAWFFRRYCNSMILPLIFFMAFNGLLMEFNLYRNMKAIDLFLLSVPFLLNRKPLQYFSINAIAVLFHTSAILYFPMYFLLDRHLSKWLIWGSVVAVNMVYLLHISIINDLINNLTFIQAMQVYDKITGYADRGEESLFSVGYFERTLTFVLFTLFYPKLIMQHKFYNFFYNCYWIYYTTLLLFYEVTVFAERVPYLFMFAYWVLYPALFQKKSVYLPLLRVFVPLLVILKIMTSTNYAGASYQNILVQTPDYYKRKALIDQSFAEQ